MLFADRKAFVLLSSRWRRSQAESYA